MNWCEYGSCWNCISYHLLIESLNKNRSNRRIWKCILENASVSSYMFDQTDENENTLQNWCKKTTLLFKVIKDIMKRTLIK